MALENNWVTYLSRSYKTIKASIISRMKAIVPEITDYSESNIFVIIVSSFAGLGEQLGYYIDNIARESFITTARRYSSLIKLTRLIDYRVRANIGSLVDITISAVDASDNLVAMDHTETLTAGLIVENDNGIQFITEKAISFFDGNTSVVVGARQRVKVTNTNLGTTTSSVNQSFLIPVGYQHDTLQITINAITWELVETFAFSGPQSKHFMVEVNESKQVYVMFGDDINGAIPPTAQSVLGTYYTCSGKEGNVEANTITNWVSTAPTPPSNTPAIDHYILNNTLPSVGGLNVEGIEDIRKHAPLSLRTLNRAVTLQDHIDLCLLVPGVGKASVEFNQDLKEITFYISPDEGGIAPSQLCTDVEDYFLNRKMISTSVRAIPAGETKLRMSLNVTVKFRRNTTEATDDIKTALQTAFGFNSSSVDKKIRKSDIISLIDNLDKVDYLTLDILTTKPYPRILTGINELLNNLWIIVNSASSIIRTWRLAIISSTQARLYYMDGDIEVFDKTITYSASDPGSANFTSTDGSLSIGIWGSFTNGDSWNIVTYPYNQDIVFDDHTIPIYSEDELNLIVNSQTGL